MNDRRALAGRAAEEWAARHLEAAGARIVARNYRRRTGELDLVAIDRGVLLIVEVRLRARSDYGGADGSIDAAKRRRIVRTTQQWLQMNRALAALPVRVDVIVVEPCERGTALPGIAGHWALRWLQHAFEVDG